MRTSNTYQCLCGYLWQSRKKIGSPSRCPKCSGRNILNLTHFQPSPVKYPGKNMLINRCTCGFEWQTTTPVTQCPRCNNTEIVSFNPDEDRRRNLLNKVTNPHLLTKLKRNAGES